MKKLTTTSLGNKGDKMNRSCGHPWGEHPYLFEHELRESNKDTLAREEELHPCNECRLKEAYYEYLSSEGRLP